MVTAYEKGVDRASSGRVSCTYSMYPYSIGREGCGTVFLAPFMGRALHLLIFLLSQALEPRIHMLKLLSFFGYMRYGIRYL
jgi:hypothetical protein